MKHFYIMVLLFFSAFSVFGQIELQSPHVTAMDRYSDRLIGLPRQRVSTSNALVLTDQWQTVAFVSGNSGLDINNFPTSRWDFVNNKILANMDNSLEQGYDLSFDMSLQNVTGMSKIQLRFVIPSPAPFYFPFPNSSTTSFVDVTTLTIQNELKNNHFQYPIYTNSDFRTYGCQIQVRALSYTNTSNILTGLISQVVQVLTGGNRVTVVISSLNIYGR